MLTRLVPAIKPYLDAPFAFFGHSLGAMIAWELARSLYSSDGISPVHMFVSGSAALPYLRENRTDTRSLADPELINELRDMDLGSAEFLPPSDRKIGMELWERRKAQ